MQPRHTPCGVCGAETEERPAGMALGVEPLWMRVDHKAPCGLDCGGGNRAGRSWRAAHGPYYCHCCGEIEVHDAETVKRNQRWI